MEDRIISVKSAVEKEYVIMEDRSLIGEIVTQYNRQKSVKFLFDLNKESMLNLQHLLLLMLN